jgi:ABC-type sugar transport system substrate-binding protein
MRLQHGKLAALGILILLLLTACGTTSSQSPGHKAPNQLVVGVSLDSLFPGRQAELNGLKAAAQKVGTQLKISVADDDAQRQNEQIQTFINEKVDAIMVVAVDENAIKTATRAATRAGIPVVTFDRELPGNTDVMFHAGLDSHADGLSCGKYIASKNDGQPHNVLELLGALNDQNAIDRSNGFEEGLAGASNLHIIKAPTDWDANKALSATENAFQANPNIWAIFIPSDFMMSSIDTALKGANRFAKAGEPDHVLSCAIDGSQPGYNDTVAATNDALVVLPLANEAAGAFQAVLTITSGGRLTASKQTYPGTLYTYQDIASHAQDIWGAQQS